ncbi:MAG: hypothetical protein ACMUFK_05090, partial [Thermoplasmatota archaeon]
VAAAFAVSFFVLRRRNQRMEDERRGKDAWSRVLFFDQGPTPGKGKVPGPDAAPSMHRLGPDLDLAAIPEQVNGGNLDNRYTKEYGSGMTGHDDVADHLSDLFDEVMNTEREGPSSEALLQRLDAAHLEGRIPRRDYREIKRKLNNIDK